MEKDDKKKGVKTLKDFTLGKKKNEIKFNPELETRQGMNEEAEKTVAMLYGRMNPPTKGHEENVEGLKALAKKHNADHVVIASHSQDSKKNPLDAKTKMKHLKRAFPGTNLVAADKEHPSIFHHLAKLHQQGYKHVIIGAGEDRADEYNKVKEYNGKEGRHGVYNFKSIKVVSTGERKQGVSGTDMRKHATSSNYDEFKKNLPSNLQKHDEHAKALYHDTRKGLGVNEEYIYTEADFDEVAEEYLQERVLDLQQRRKRAIQMRKIAPKLQRARAIAMHRLAGDKQLKRRAFKMAKDILRKRYAGQRGAHYHELGPTDRISVDKQIDSKVSAIKRIAARLMPRLKQAEAKRLQAVRSGTKPAGLGGVQPGMVAASFDPLLKMVEGLYESKEEFDTVMSIAQAALNKVAPITEQEKHNIQVKSKLSGIDSSILEEVFRRGLLIAEGNEKQIRQHAFQRLNSFVSGGKAFYEDDSDLAEQLGQDKSRNARENDAPFEPDPKKGPIATPGKHGQGYSTARHLARMGLKQFMDKQKEKLKEEAELSEATDLNKHIADFSKGIKSSSAKQSTYKRDNKPIPNMKHVETDADHQKVFDHLKKMGYKKSSGYDSNPHKFDMHNNHETMISKSDPVHHSSGISAHIEKEHGSKMKVHFTQRNMKEGLDLVSEAKDQNKRNRMRELAKAGLVDKQDYSKFDNIMSKIMTSGNTDDISQQEKAFLATMYDRLSDVITSNQQIFQQVKKKV